MIAALAMGAETVLFAQMPRTQSIEDGATGSLAGRLTDLHSNPLGGVTVVLRNPATSAEARTTTTNKGAYIFDGLEPGEYTLTAESPELGRGEVESIVVVAGYSARVDIALDVKEAPFSADYAQIPVVNRPNFEPTPLPLREIELAVEPMRFMSLRGRRVDWEIPVALPELKSTLATDPLQTLPLAERGWEGTTGLAAVSIAPATGVAANSQVSEARPGAPVFVGGAVLAQTRPTVQAVVPAQVVQPTQAPDTPIQAASQGTGPADPAATTTMSAAELRALPVSGRRWQDFALDNTPTSAAPAGGQGRISLHGAIEPPEIAIDGVGNGLAFGPANGSSGSGEGSSGRGALGQGGSGPAGMAQVGSGGQGLAISEMAIRTVETEAGYVETASSRGIGGRMKVETLSGGNKLHGQGFLFDRGNLFGARNPFTQWVKETAPATLTTIPVFTPESYTPPDRETILGIGLGSRILRKKLFWFAALDNYERNDPGLASVKHPDVFFAQPTNDQMQVLSAQLGLSSVNPVAEGLAAYSTMLETLNGMLGPAPRTATQWTGFGRLDWEAAERHRITLEGIGARWNSPGGGLTRTAETYGNHSFGSSKASEEWLLGRWEYFLTPNLLATTQASAGRIVLEALPDAPSSFEQSFLKGNAWGQLPQIVVDSRYGFTIGNPSRFGTGSYPDEHLYQEQESVDWIRGKLLVKAGFNASHNADATGLLRNQTGTYYYANLNNFVSDALVFGAFGLSGALDPFNQHNCDQTGKVWRDAGGTLRGLGYLPCYSYYSQTMGPSSWHLSTNDWAGFATAQWEPNKMVVLSAGLRWEREQLPPPLAALKNPELPLTERLPSPGNNWGPRVALAMGTGKNHLPVLRLGYGMYFGRTENLTLETALTQTGSFHGDLSFFMRPTDNLNAGGAPPFPYVLQGKPGSVVKPGAVEFAENFRNPEVHQAIVSVEETLPSHMEVTASAMVSLGRRLPISIDTNFDTSVNPGTITYAVEDSTGAGPIKAAQITVPFYASWPSTSSKTGFAGRLNPDYQQITQIMSRANSTYEAWMLKVVRYGRHGLSLRAHYTYAHAMDWNPNESSQAAGNDVLDPANFNQEYGTSNLDVRHSAGGTVIYEMPWKLRGTAGKLGNGWMASGVGQFHSGMPYTMRTSGSLAEEFNILTGAAIVGLGPGMNGSGGDNRVFGVGSDKLNYNIGRNTFRYPATWKADLRLGRRFDLGEMRQLELLAESFNLFNHQNVTELETTGYYLESGSPSSFPTLNFLTGLKANTTAFGQPLNVNATNFYRERQIQFGLRIRF
jgi:hypothetical protein